MQETLLGRKAEYLESGFSVIQLALIYKRSKLPINSRVGTLSTFIKPYGSFRILGTLAKTSGHIGTLGDIASIGVNTVDYVNGDITPIRYSYRVSGALASIGGGMAAGSAFGGPVGGIVGTGISTTFTVGEWTYDTSKWWIKEMSIGLGSLEYSLKNSIPMKVP